MVYYSSAKSLWTTGLVPLHSNKEEKEFISKYVDLKSTNTMVLKTNAFEIASNPGCVNAIVNFNKINGIRFINKYFEKVNALLKNEDYFVGCFETLSARKERLQIYKIPILSAIYLCFEFVFHRVFPKVKGLKKIYFSLTKGKDRVLSTAEALGRLVCCGFEIIDHQVINGLSYFIVKKVKEPAFDLHPSYGLLYKMPRVGKGGCIIGVYKFRTMHPYSEYLQDYVIKHNGYSSIGKPANDFRLTSWGRFMRKYWLDELPQLLNVLKGEMCLVGVRPLSKRFLAEYPERLREKRLKFKPGCVPPYVALLKQDVKQYLESEDIYFKEKEKHPFTTDIKYFLKALANIITNKIKSA